MSREGSITLHPKLGVNPRLTFCRRCKKPTDELILAGRRNHKVICSCGLELYFAPLKSKCPGCGSGLYGAKRVELSEFERVPAMEMCDACKKESQELEDAVAAGGVYFNCENCHASGVIRKSPFADMVREKSGVPAGKPCGVTFGKDHLCPQCSNESPSPQG